MPNMLKNKPDKKIAEIQPTFENILICKDNKSRPFIEIMVQDPENIEQQNLGTLIGIFEISDISEDSSYIVNYLLSIIKKEFFLRPRRGPVESFEAALHKANLALSKLAEHKNIGWIGKLNVICAVFEKNRLHLAKSGAASVFLLRSRTLTDISEDLSEQEVEPNPLKTFDNVSSGKLEIGDKLIFTTDNIFDIFSFEEIKKSALRFSDTELIQFFRTALGNQLERAAALIVGIKEGIPEPEVPVSRRPAVKINAFSQTAFVKPAKARNGAEREIVAELDKSKEEFANKKTGHIYIKEADQPPVTSHFFGDLSFYADNFFEALGLKLRRAGRTIYEALERSFRGLRTKAGDIKIGSPKNGLERGFLMTKERLSAVLGKIRRPKKTLESEKIEDISREATPRIPQVKFDILPSFSKLQNYLSSFSYEYKLYAILVVLVIILVPYFGLQLSKKMAEKNTPVVQEAPPVVVPLSQDKNVVRVENLLTAYSGQDVLGTINLNGKLFSVAQTEITALDTGEKFAIPQDFGRIVMTAGMNDLNLIFLINSDGRTISFSSVSRKFQNNKLAVPRDSTIADTKTYLTYIYLLDAKNSQIYRYPRAEGGFGQKIDWIKETLDLSNATNMAINENIFVADGKNILKLFRGKKQDFDLEQSATPIVPFKISVSTDGSVFYVLDKVNSRIVKLDASGNIISQYYNADIGSATDLAVDEVNNTVYFSTPDTVKSFRME